MLSKQSPARTTVNIIQKGKKPIYSLLALFLWSNCVHIWTILQWNIGKKSYHFGGPSSRAKRTDNAVAIEILFSCCCSFIFHFLLFSSLVGTWKRNIEEGSFPCSKWTCAALTAFPSLYTGKAANNHRQHHRLNICRYCGWIGKCRICQFNQIYLQTLSRQCCLPTTDLKIQLLLHSSWPLRVLIWWP